MNKSTNVFIGAISAGFLLGVLIAPLKGKLLREILFSPDNTTDFEDETVETYSINELISKDSTSFEDLKEKIRNGS
ncbi:MAG: YtxH domain-containing protein [Chitinophagales bacterium]